MTSRKDQAQYWADRSRPYKFVPVKKFVAAFQQSEVGRQNAEDLARPPLQPSKDSPDPLIRTRWAPARCSSIPSRNEHRSSADVS